MLLADKMDSKNSDSVVQLLMQSEQHCMLCEQHSKRRYIAIWDAPLPIARRFMPTPPFNRDGPIWPLLEICEACCGIPKATCLPKAIAVELLQHNPQRYDEAIMDILNKL